MDPLPSVSRACLMTEKVEQQRLVTAVPTHIGDAAVATVSKGVVYNSSSTLDHSGSGSSAFLTKRPQCF